jgi:predicted nucleic acid-binding protein
MILLDASVLIAAYDESDPEHAAAAKLIENGDVATIDLAAYEVLNWAELKVGQPVVGNALRALLEALVASGRLVRWDGAMLGALLGVVREHDYLTSYDAAYVVAARQLDAKLVSCDVRDLVGHGLAVLPSALA